MVHIAQVYLIGLDLFDILHISDNIDEGEILIFL